MDSESSDSSSSDDSSSSSDAFSKHKPTMALQPHQAAPSRPIWYHSIVESNKVAFASILKSHQQKLRDFESEFGFSPQKSQATMSPEKSV